MPNERRSFGHRGVRILASVAFLTLPTLSAAQRVTVTLRGDSARRLVTPSNKVALPVVLDLSAAAGMNIAAVTVAVTFAADRLTFDSVRTAGFGTLTPTTTNATAGALSLDVRDATGTIATRTLATLHFTTAPSYGATPIQLSPTLVQTSGGVNVLSIVRSQRVDVCVAAAAGIWGDVNGDPVSQPLGDGEVNIVDAQQIARNSVGLAVQNRPGLLARGDVSADGVVNIIDAQQIARFSVSLSAPARVATAAIPDPSVASVAMLPATSQNVLAGASVQLDARARDANGVDVSPCAPVVWSSGNPSVATVSPSGLVTGVAAGTATVTSSSLGKAGSVIVNVAAVVPPQLLWTTYFPGSTVGDAMLWGIVLDQNENVVAVGNTSQNYQTGTFRTIAVSTDNGGRPRWTYLSDTSVSALSVTLGPDPGSVILAGRVSGTPALIGLDSTGGVQFARTCDSMVNDSFTSITPVAGRLYMTTHTDLRTADLSGNPDCGHSFDLAIGDLDQPWSMGVRPFGTSLALLVQYQRDNAYWSGRRVPVVQQLTGSGQRTWRTDFESLISPTAASANGALGVADEAGGTVIYISTSLIFNDQAYPDWARYATAKLDATGSLQWMDLWNGDERPSTCEAYPYAAVPDPRGGVIVAGMGSTDCATAWDSALASYTADGVRRWSMRPVFNGNRNDNISGAAVSADGRFLYIMGQTAPTFQQRQDLYIAKYALP